MHIENFVFHYHILNTFEEAWIVILFCFVLQGETYSFKEAIVLGEYKTDDSSVTNDKKGEKVSRFFKK